MPKVACRLPPSYVVCFGCFCMFPTMHKDGLAWGFSFKILPCPKASRSSAKLGAPLNLLGGQCPRQAVSSKLSAGHSVACVGCSCRPCRARSSLLAGFSPGLPGVLLQVLQEPGRHHSRCHVPDFGGRSQPSTCSGGGGSSFLLAWQERRGLGSLYLCWVPAVLRLARRQLCSFWSLLKSGKT